MLQKYMLILSVNFENIIVGLHVIVIFFILINFKNIKDQLLCHQTNVKISNFYDLNLFIKISLSFK